MLDDLKFIHEKDADDVLGTAGRQWQQVLEEYSIKVDKKSFNNVVISGMGGSALAAALAQSWPGFKVPFVISRDYSIPQFLDDKSLFIASSYSGNTEETLTALASAEETGATIVIISSGGKLEEIAKEKSYTFAKLPGGLQPRHATLYGLKALVEITG